MKPSPRVVISVRITSEAAKRIVAIAKARGFTPSALTSWLIECMVDPGSADLDRLLDVGTEIAAAEVVYRNLQAEYRKLIEKVTDLQDLLVKKGALEWVSDYPPAPGVRVRLRRSRKRKADSVQVYPDHLQSEKERAAQAE